MWRWLKGEPASSAFAGYPSFAIEQIAPNNPLTNNIFAGITAMSTNKTWYGGDIVSSYMEEKPDYLQYDESTDAFSIWLGEITRHGKNGIEGLSPKKVNYLIDQYSGFIGDWLLPALSKKADVPAVVKAFVVDSVRQNRLGSDFYDALDEAKQVKETEFATAAMMRHIPTCISRARLHPKSRSSSRKSTTAAKRPARRSGRKPVTS